MTTTVIVQESVEHYEPPQRATANLEIGFAEFSREQAHQRVSEVLGDVRAQVEGMYDGSRGLVTWYSVSGARTWVRKDDDGTRFREEVVVKAKFRDFPRLGSWLDSVLRRQGVRLRSVTWSVTERRRKELEAQLRKAAVRAAMGKAEQYAAAAGMRVVSVRTIADRGYLAKGAGYSGAAAAPSRGGKAPGAGTTSDTYQFSPEDILMSASVEAEFLAE